MKTIPALFTLVALATAVPAVADEPPFFADWNFSLLYMMGATGNSDCLFMVSVGSSDVLPLSLEPGETTGELVTPGGRHRLECTREGTAVYTNTLSTSPSTE